jgi:hypothetical protein
VYIFENEEKSETTSETVRRRKVILKSQIYYKIYYIIMKLRDDSSKCHSNLNEAMGWCNVAAEVG